jgi:hypothetical protein
MKFEDLYNKVFVSEEQQKEPADNTEVAMPEDFDDVKPMPLPETPEATNDMSSETEEEQPAPAVSPETSTNVQDYITKLEDFANNLNDPQGSSLQTLVSNLDRPGTPFEGISNRTKTEIVRAAEILRSISEQLKSFIINAAKS